MPKLRICAEICGICEDENKNPCWGGFEINLGDFPEEGFEEKYKRLMESVTPEMILQQAGLSEIFEPKDCRIISPKEFDELYGED